MASLTNIFAKLFDTSFRVSQVGEDRLSMLPDELLITILSKIKRKNVIKHIVQTSVLSKRWKTVWMKMSRVKLDESYYGNVNYDDGEAINSIAYWKTADRFYQVILAAAKFREAKTAIIYLVTSLSMVKCLTLLDNLMEIKDLKLKFSIRGDNYYLLNKFPSSLVKLKLEGGISLDLASKYLHIPTMRFVHFRGIIYAHGDIFSKLEKVTPNLENLIVDRESWDRVEHMVIAFSRLKVFRMTFYPFEDRRTEASYKLTIRSPALERLELVDHGDVVFEIGTMELLKYASIYLWTPAGAPVSYMAEVSSTFDPLRTAIADRRGRFMLKMKP